MKLNLKLFTSSFLFVLAVSSQPCVYASVESNLTDNIQQVGTTRPRSDRLAVHEASAKRPCYMPDVVVVNHAENLLMQDENFDPPLFGDLVDFEDIGDIVYFLNPAVVFDLEEPRFKDGLPKDVMRLIFSHACKMGANPVDLSFVCKHWHKAMCQNEPVVGKLKYVDMNIFMKHCMHLYSEQLIRNMRLIIADPKTGAKTEMCIPADADLSKFIFDATSGYRITTSVDEFFKVKNCSASVLISNYDVVHRSYPNRFRRIKDWNPAVAPVGVFLRDSRWKNVGHFNHLVISSIDELSSFNLYEIWEKSDRGRRHFSMHTVWSGKFINFSFLKAPL